MAAIAVEVGPVRLQQELQQAIVELPDRAHLPAVAPDGLRRAVHRAVHRDARGVVLQPLDAGIERAGPAPGEGLVVVALLVERAAPELGAVGGDSHRAGAAERVEKAFTLAAGMGARPGPRLSGLDILDLVWTGKSPPRRGRAGLEAADMQSAKIGFFLAGTC